MGTDPTGSAVSWEQWHAGLIPGPAQWVKDPMLPQLRLRIGSLALKLHMLWGDQKRKKKNNKDDETGMKGEKTVLDEGRLAVLPCVQRP